MVGAGYLWQCFARVIGCSRITSVALKIYIYYDQPTYFPSLFSHLFLMYKWI